MTRPGELPTEGRPPVQLPAGCELPDGRFLTFQPHRDCPCVDCRDAFAALEAGTLRLPDPDDRGLPW